MSRLGKIPATIPAGVEVSVVDKVVTVKGPKGTLTKSVHPAVTITVADGKVVVEPVATSSLAPAMWGTYSAHVKNMILGVTEGFTKKMQIEGVGYRAEMKGRTLALSMGFSHPVNMELPEGIDAIVEKNIITISGIDKEALGQFAADVRAIRPPEPYKGKGIRHVGEFIIRKQGKKAV